MSKLVVIAGITGNQGGSVADVFQTSKEWYIRAITRHTLKTSTREWSSRGIGLVRAVRAEVEKPGISPEQRCAEIEVQRGKNLALAAASPEVQRTLERYVYSSLGNHWKLSGRNYTQIWYCDSKAAVEQYERDAPVLGPKSSFIHVGLYADNWKFLPLEIQKDSVSEGYWHTDIDDGRKPYPLSGLDETSVL